VTRSSIISDQPAQPEQPDSSPDKVRSASWLTAWDPEDTRAWDDGASKVAWRTLWVTTFALVLAFAVWFMVSALVVRLPQIGFDLSTQQLFWLAAMPGLAAGTLRIVHMFLIPIFGTRHTVSVSTLLLVVPVLGWFFAVQNPDTPYPVLLGLAFLAGLGGGNFSSFMPSTSLYFPKRLQGTALAVQAGIGNFGVSLVQFLTPVLIGTALLGGALGASQTLTIAGTDRGQVWLQNAAIVWLPLVLLAAAAAWWWLRSVPVRANFREQADIFSSRHTWIMTSLYIMTFGSFSGLAAAFPLLIRDTYGVFDGGPDPLAFAFLGPLVGSLFRVVAGPVSDRFGGAKVTQVAAVGLTLSAVAVTFFVDPSTVDTFGWFVTSMLALFFFAGVGNASTFKQIPMLFEKRQAGGVIGFTAAVAAYGPFAVAGVMGAVIAATGSAVAFFWGLAVFYALNTGLNWWFYARRGAPHPC
jgi:MFS transporter, NNP family, nitrate/nitrite transporter